MKNAQMAVTINGGATRIKEIVVLNPRVAVSVGKNALNDNAVTSDVNAKASHQTLQSVTASQRPLLWRDDVHFLLIRLE